MLRNKYVKQEEANDDGAAGGSVDDSAAKIAQLELELKETRQEAASRRVQLKSFEGVDVEEYNALKSTQAESKQAELEKNGNFEAAKQAIIDSYEAKLSDITADHKNLQKKHKQSVVTDNIVSTAATMNAINPSQVSMLLRDNVRLNKDGDVEVLDKSGNARFNEKGDLLSVSSYVESFLTENPYMVQGSKSGTGSKGGEHKANDNNMNLSKDERIAKGLSKLFNK